MEQPLCIVGSVVIRVAKMVIEGCTGSGTASMYCR